MASWLLLLATVAVASAQYSADTSSSTTDYSILQLPEYAETACISELTTSAGSPVAPSQLSSLNSEFLRNEFFVDALTHITHMAIPERIVHAKGYGAFGYLNITHDITKYTKAKIFSEIGKVTPLVTRFSKSVGSKGSQDTVRGGRGMAFKFYTDEGIWDLLTMSAPIFGIKDPNTVLGFVHMLNGNPVTHVSDPNQRWDFFNAKPEALNVFLRIFTDEGIPDGYRYQLGHAVHTFQLVNADNETYFAKFQFQPTIGLKFLNATYAASLAASDPDYSQRDLYNAIAGGDYPEWIMYIQPFTEADIEEIGSDAFDVTKWVSEEKYPIQQVGKITLNRNPTNFFQDIEQLALNPGNLVPGIVGGPDSIFEARRLSYRDTQIHRLGVNFNNIPVNRPAYAATFNREGAAPQGETVVQRQAPSYWPNTYSGPVPTADEQPPLRRVYVSPETTNWEQSNDYWITRTDAERTMIVNNIVATLKLTEERIQLKAVEVFANLNTTFSERIASGLNLTTTSS